MGPCSSYRYMPLASLDLFLAAYPTRRCCLSPTYYTAASCGATTTFSWYIRPSRTSLRDHSGTPPLRPKTKEKGKRKSTRRTQKKTEENKLSAPPGPLLLHLLRGDCRLHFNLHAAPLLRRWGAWDCCHGSLRGLGPSLPSWRGW